VGSEPPLRARSPRASLEEFFDLAPSDLMVIVGFDGYVKRVEPGVRAHPRLPRSGSLLSPGLIWSSSIRKTVRLLRDKFGELAGGEGDERDRP